MYFFLHKALMRYYSKQAVRKGQQQQQHQQPQVQQHPQQGQGPDGSRPQPQLPREPEVANVTFSKVKGSMGLSIVAAVPKGEPQKESGIYIKSVVTGGAAALDGRLQAGDQLLEVDGKSLVGLSQERAAELMTRTGQTVTLKVAKQGAFYHGLATLLSQPSPVLPRASPKKPSSPQVGKHRPHEEGPPPYNGNQDLDRNRPTQNKQQMMAQSRSSPALNSDNMGPGGRAVSMGNIRDQPQHSPHGHRMPPGHHGNMREPDPKSKSIPNLRMDNSFDHREPTHHQQQQHMRPAASVGALQHPNAAFHEYYNQGRPDPRGNDYENHPSMDPRTQRGPPDPRRNERDYQDMSQTLPPGLMGRGQVRHGSDGPPSSRNSGSSFRDDRPHSAYFGQGQMEKPDYRDDRPKSMEVTLDRVQDMHQRFGPPQHSPHQSPHESSFENDRDPNYMNTRAQRQHQMQSGYVNQSDIPKLTAHNEARQPNFYENTSPRQNEPSPAFHQLKRPPFETENKVRPQPMPKPSVAPKPNAPKAIPADIPRIDVDNRQTQSHFFEPHLHHDQRIQNSDPRMQRVPTSHHQNFIPGQPHLSLSQGMNSLPHQKHSPGREMYVQPTHQSPELPPPPQEIPPELPPPPAPEDLPEELPPLPPPPVNDYRLDSMDPQYANQTDSRSFGSQPGYPHHQLNQPQQRVQPHMQDSRFGNRENPDRQRIMGYAEPQRQQPQLSMAASVPRGFQPNNDYQNIPYEHQNKSFNAPSQHSPGQNVYESYDPKSRGKPQGMDIQQNKHRLMAEVNDFAKSKKDGVSPLTSPWDREEMEKSQKVREEEMNRLREQEIQELESRPYLTPQEQDRLRKLRLEQEFQRRVQEVSGRDEDEDSDTDISNRSQGREFLMQTIQEDLMKAQQRLEDLNHRQQYEEYQREKDRMLRLERKLEIFEQEREERQQRLQKRQEKKQKEQEEYQRKQRELREKQRQEFEEQKRAMQLEEEKIKRRQQEEERRRKEFEKERLREIEAQKEREEAAARAEIRRREEEYQRQQMEQRERERREQEREIRVNEERKRLDAMSHGYQPYANLPATQSQHGAPPPPQRGSSYDITNNSSMGRSAPNFGRNDLNQNSMNSMNNGFRNSGPGASSSLKMQENSVFVPKKSVSFNTQLETRNTYSVGSESRGSQSSYRTNSVSSDQNEASSPNVHNSFPQTNNVNDSVFTSTNSTPQQNHINYRTGENTPNVVGAQEVYRDPRNRIQAQREAQDRNVIKKSGNADRMSFRDKMKFFAQEAGEGTPKDKSKVSKTLRDIESQLHNGQ